MKKEYLTRFIEAYKKATSEDLTEAEALVLAKSLIDLYLSVFGNILDLTKNKNEKEG